MQVSLANGITTATPTYGPSVGVQVFGSTEPIVVDVFGKLTGTSGATSATLIVQESVDGTTYTTAATIALSSTSTAAVPSSKPFAVQVKVRKPYVRAGVTAISGTTATVYANLRMA